MKNYMYTGANTAITLVLKNGESQDFQLWHGKTVSLPAHEYVDVLKAQGLLIDAAPADSSEAVSATKKGKGE